MKNPLLRTHRLQSRSIPSAYILIPLLMLTLMLPASQVRLSFAEVAQSADLIFVGTVDSLQSRFNEQGTLIVTDVVFRDVVDVSSSARSVQQGSSSVVLQYAGGCVGDLCLDTSVMPTLEPGRRYLLFVTDDGRNCINPVIGGTQGQFKVVRDAETGEEYVLTMGDHMILDGDEDGPVVDSERVTAIRGGTPVYAPRPPAAADDSMAPPTPANPMDSAYPARNSHTRPASDRVFRLADFTDYINRVSLKTPLKTRLLRPDDSPPAPETNTLAWDMGEGPAPVLPVSPEPAESPAGVSRPQGGTLGYCGYHTLPFVMKTVPTDWWSYDIFEAARQTWNWFMDIYQKQASDGKYGHNNRNEVCGWVDDSDMYRIYGVHWNSYIGWAHTWWISGAPCGRLLESDIMFNPSYDWTSNEENAWGNDDVILLRPTAMHEMAHTWGMQRGSQGQWGYYETYDYDQLTVVHSYYHNIIEDGKGIHKADAFCLRRDYSSRTQIKNTVDLGVESYYADGGLKNSTSDSSTYYPGDPITLNNITVENNSYNNVANVRLRVYLSTDRTITNTDYLVGTYWNWASFKGESRSVFDVTTSVPSGIPAGTYYIGLKVTVNGDKADDYTLNNRTTFFATIQVKVRSTGGDDNGNSSGGGGCFIATAAFGSPLTAQVTTLRDFRDHWLLTNGPGRDFVRTYYRYSPPLARLISAHPVLKPLVQSSLLPLVALSRVLGQLEAWL